MPLGNVRSDGLRPICWESRVFGERVPSTFADRAERAYLRSRDPHHDIRRLVAQDDIRRIGSLDTVTGVIELGSERDATDLASWLGTTELDPSELSTTRGVIVQLYRDLVRVHGELVPEPEQAKRAGHASGTKSTGARNSWHTG